MPFKAAGNWVTTFSKVLLNGPPMSTKTKSLLTFPRPLHALGVPGEEGMSTLMHDPEAGVHVYTWEDDKDVQGQVLKVASPQEKWQAMNRWIVDLAAGTYGPVATAAVDGAHKIYDLLKLVRNWSVDLEDRGKTSSALHADFTNFVSKFLGAPFPQKVVCCFDGVEQEQGSTVKEVFPGLYGKMSKEVLGYFPVVFHTRRKPNPVKYVWELEPSGTMQGAGMHVPEHIRRLFPKEIEIVVDASPEGLKLQRVTGGWQAVQAILAKAAEGAQKGA